MEIGEIIIIVNHEKHSSKKLKLEYLCLAGLDLTMNVEQYEYVPYLTQSSGIKVLIHDPFHAPFPADAGLVLSPNAHTSLNIKKVCK